MGASLTLLDSCLYLFGGNDETNEKLNDLWQYDLTTKQWKEIKPESEIPLVSYKHLNYSNFIGKEWTYSISSKW